VQKAARATLPRDGESHQEPLQIPGLSPTARAAFTQRSARPLCGLSGSLGVIAKFCIYNVLAHAYTIKELLSYVVMSPCVAQIRDELVVSITQGTHQEGIHYFVLENMYLEFSLKKSKNQLRLTEKQQCPHSP